MSLNGCLIMHLDLHENLLLLLTHYCQTSILTPISATYISEPTCFFQCPCKYQYQHSCFRDQSLSNPGCYFDTKTEAIYVPNNSKKLVTPIAHTHQFSLHHMIFRKSLIVQTTTTVNSLNASLLGVEITSWNWTLTTTICNLRFKLIFLRIILLSSSSILISGLDQKLNGALNLNC